MTTETAGAAWSVRRCLLNLVWILFATDAALLVLHLATGLDAFDLDREANLATWYASAKLLGIAAVSAAIFAASARTRSDRRLWLVNAAIFLGLSADEAASLHESLARRLLELPGLDGLRGTLTGGDEFKTSHAWVWLFLPLIVAAAWFFTRLFTRSLATQPRGLALFAVGLACLLSAVALEAAVTGFPPVADWGATDADRYRLLTTFEEGAELIGASLIFAAASLHLARVVRPSRG